MSIADMIEVLFLLTTFLLFYTYLGYPLLIAVLGRLFPRPHAVDEDFLPEVTLIISAYNEEQVIGDKLDNALALDYPADRLRVMVVSDASTDETDAIVEEFAERSVTLLRASDRYGKTAGLNLALEQITSDIVVFSDANALYDAGAIRCLVRHFADPQVGYVVGHARYLVEEQNAAGVSEDSYWNFETRLKQHESDFASVVGGDGAIYAIRRELWEPLQQTDINDFVNPLQIVAKGYRGIFDAEAWCTEQPSGDFGREFGRKVRIVNRSFNGLLRVPRVLNPLSVGRFALLIVSHKLLRWFSPFLLLAHVLFSLFAAGRGPIGKVALTSAALYALASVLVLVGAWREKAGAQPLKLFFFPYYLYLMNVASARGILLRFKGINITTWNTVREGPSPAEKSGLPRTAIPLLVLAICLFRLLFWRGWGEPLASLAVYALIGAIFYTYLGYPALLALISSRFAVKVERDEELCPSATLLIAAYNEAAVIGEKLDNALALDYPADRLRILVADDGSRDETAEIVRGFADRGVELLALEQNRGKISALNDAMQQIDSEIVIFSDANVMYDRQALRKLARNFKDSKVGGASGKVILLNTQVSYGSSENRYYSIEHFIQDREGGLGAMMGADGAMYAIRRSLFQPLPADTILDDLVISMNVVREGYWLIHEKEALGYEKNLQEIGGEFRRKTRIIAGGIQCLLRGAGVPAPGRYLQWFQFISHKLLRWLIGPMAVLLLLLLTALFVGAEQPGPPLQLLFWGVLTATLVAAVSHLFPAARRLLPVNLVHYLFMLKLASLAGCWQGLRGRQKVTWKRG